MTKVLMTDATERRLRAVERSRLLLVALAVFDLALGISATLFPDFYLRVMHPDFSVLHPDGPTYWLARTGALWLFFAAAAAVAAIRPARWPFLVFLVGGLRLMDVPADLVYFFAADDLGRLGAFGLLFSPLFNLLAGAYLAAVGLRCLSPIRARSRAAQ